MRELAERGVWLGAHPDVILKMGAKSVLYATKALGWGVDTQMHRSVPALEASLGESLRQGPRVLKRNRGNGGQGVWKVEAAPGGAVTVLEARRGGAPQALQLAAYLQSLNVNTPLFEAPATQLAPPPAPAGTNAPATNAPTANAPK